MFLSCVQCDITDSSGGPQLAVYCNWFTVRWCLYFENTENLHKPGLCFVSCHQLIYFHGVTGQCLFNLPAIQRTKKREKTRMVTKEYKIREPLSWLIWLVESFCICSRVSRTERFSGPWFPRNCGWSKDCTHRINAKNTNFLAKYF